MRHCPHQLRQSLPNESIVEEELEDSIDDAIGGDGDDGDDGDGDLLAEEAAVKDPVEVDPVAGKVSEFISCHTAECKQGTRHHS